MIPSKNKLASIDVMLIPLIKGCSTNLNFFFQTSSKNTSIFYDAPLTEKKIIKIIKDLKQYKFKIENDELIMYKSIEKEGDLSEYFTFNMINGEKLNYYDLKLSNS